jgi:hypothetical protein
MRRLDVSPLWCYRAVGGERDDQAIDDPLRPGASQGPATEGCPCRTLSASNLVNDAVRRALREDQEDLTAFADRAAEPTISYEPLLEDLKAHGGL